MPLNPQQKVCLVDSQGRELGTAARPSVLLCARRIEGNRIFAQFTAGQDFAAVANVFHEFENAVNDQLFHEVDDLSSDIDALGLRLVSGDGSDSLQLEDVQIMNGADLSCRVPNLALTQATPATAHAG